MKTGGWRWDTLIALALTGLSSLPGCWIRERRPDGALPRGFFAADESVPLRDGLPIEIVCLKDGSRMRLVPAGSFVMGSSAEELSGAWDAMDERSKKAYGITIEALRPECPRSLIDIAYSYYIDTCEVTNRQYLMFCKETGKPHPPRTGGKRFIDFLGRPDDPVVNVTYMDAESYCRWAGKDLPLETEWEKAARGADGRIYPWGNSYDPTACNHGLGYPPWLDKNNSDGFELLAPVGSFPKGMSPYGMHDMAGNVWEWCKKKAAEPQAPLKGGSYDHEKTMLRCAVRGKADPETYITDRGFRAVLRLDRTSRKR